MNFEHINQFVVQGIVSNITEVVQTPNAQYCYIEVISDSIFGIKHQRNYLQIKVFNGLVKLIEDIKLSAGDKIRIDGNAASYKVNGTNTVQLIAKKIRKKDK